MCILQDYGDDYHNGDNDDDDGDYDRSTPPGQIVSGGIGKAETEHAVSTSEEGKLSLSLLSLSL